MYFLLLYTETFASVYVCVSLCACCLRGPEAILDPLDLEWQMVMTHHVDPGNWSRGLCKRSKCSQLLSHHSSPSQKQLFLTGRKKNLSSDRSVITTKGQRNMINADKINMHEHEYKEIYNKPCGGEDSSVSKRLALIAWGPKLNAQNPNKQLKVVVSTSNLKARIVQTGGCLGQEHS